MRRRRNAELIRDVVSIAARNPVNGVGHQVDTIVAFREN
jgi:hypothetical protein